MDGDWTGILRGFLEAGRSLDGLDGDWTGIRRRLDGMDGDWTESASKWTESGRKVDGGWTESGRKVDGGWTEIGRSGRRLDGMDGK